MISSTTQQPIFIVGLPRSGTTLLAVMLSAHSHLSCGPETHVFRNLYSGTKRNICSAKTWPDSAVDYLFSLRLGDSYPVPHYYSINWATLSDHLRGKDRTLTSVASALPELFMEEQGQMRWIEKTPDHLLHVDTIRTLFPDAPIIRIRRDPRDVALSLLNVPWGPDTFLEALIYCHRYHNIFNEFFHVDRNSYSVHYEALLSSPERELLNICDFLREPFEPSMLDTQQAAKHVQRTNEEPWKAKVAEKVDKSRAHAWRHVLTAEQKRQADALIGGYTEERDALARTLPAFVRISGYTHRTDRAALEVIDRMLQAATYRFWPACADERPVGTFFIGNPGSGEWLGYGSRWERLRNALAIAGQIAQLRICGHPFAWPYVGETDRSNQGFCSLLISVAVGRTTRTLIPGSLPIDNN